MNILFVHDHEVNPFKGGMQRVSYLLAEEFARRGHKPTFLSLREDPQEFSGKGEIPQYSLPLERLGTEKLKKEIEKFIKEKKIGFVMLQHPELKYRGALTGLKDLATTVFVFHNQPFALLGKERKIKSITPAGSLRLKGKLLRLLGIYFPRFFRKIYLRQIGGQYKNIVDLADKLILLSDLYIPRVLENTPGINKEKVSALNNPITFTIEESSIDFDKKENIILVVCRITNPQKNLTDFIDIWKEFSQKRSDWKAILVGDGESRKYIEKYVKRKRVERLQFEGNRENVHDYYRRAKIFCMTSSYEGWPMVLMEAMAFGCVPLAFDTFEALHEIIENGKDGFIIPPFDKEAMVETIMKLADSPRKLKDAAMEGRKKLSYYSVENIANQWDTIIVEK